MAEANLIQCPNCGQAYFVQPHQWGQYLGQTINCTRCGKPFTVTAPASAQGPTGVGGDPGQGVDAVVTDQAGGMSAPPPQGVPGGPPPPTLPPGYPAPQGQFQPG